MEIYGVEKSAHMRTRIKHWSKNSWSWYAELGGLTPSLSWLPEFQRASPQPQTSGPFPGSLPYQYKDPTWNRTLQAHRSSRQVWGLFIFLLIFLLHLILKYNHTNILGKPATKKSRDQNKHTQGKNSKESEIMQEARESFPYVKLMTTQIYGILDERTECSF